MKKKSFNYSDELNYLYFPFSLFSVFPDCFMRHQLAVALLIGGSDADEYNTIQYNTIQYNTIQYNTIQYNTIQYNTIQYNTIQYNKKKYNTIQYDTIQ